MSTTFTFGGTALSTIGTVAHFDDYLAAPARRGGDLIIPFQDGEVFVQKFYGTRTITVYLHVSAASETALETLLDTLNALIALRTERVLAMTMAGSAVRNINASVNRKPDVKVEYATASKAFAKVAIEFVATKPFWRSNTLLDVTTTINASPKTFTLTNTGGAQERSPSFVIDGPFSSIAITNSTTGAVLTYTGAIGAAETVTISVNSTGEWTAVLSTGSANVIGNVTHTGDSALMTFNL